MISSHESNYLVKSRPETLLILVKPAINEQSISKDAMCIEYRIEIALFRIYFFPYLIRGQHKLGDGLVRV